MKLDDFSLGTYFRTPDGDHWKVSDKGSRVVVAIPVGTDNAPIDPDMLKGPPFNIPEYVFDEENMKACSPLGIDRMHSAYKMEEVA